MKMKEIIDKVSDRYRKETSYFDKIRTEYNDVVKKLAEADHDRGENITLAEYQYLSARKQALRNEMDMHGNYCAGISTIRELLMDLGFETEVT